MKKKLLNPGFTLILFACILFFDQSQLPAQESTAKVKGSVKENVVRENDLSPWLSAGAFTIPQKRLQAGLFQALRYGYSERVEFSTHPLVFFIMPNMEMKWRHGKLGAFYIASHHSLFYPTLLLRSIAREGTGGIISPEFTIPHMFAIYNEFIGTLRLSRSHFLSINGGLSFSVKLGKLDRRTTIDLPIVYQRLDVFYSGYQLRLGTNFQGTVSGRWNYFADGVFFISPSSDQGFSFEHEALILWNKSDTFQITVGYKLVYGQYPFGSQWHLLLPLLDFQKAWTWK